MALRRPFERLCSFMVNQPKQFPSLGRLVFPRRHPHHSPGAAAVTKRSLTALALLLGSSSTHQITYAFSIHRRLYRANSRVCFKAFSSSSVVVRSANHDELLDDSLLDKSKFPRLFVGNPHRTRHCSSQNGLTAALQNGTTTNNKHDSTTTLAQDSVVGLTADQSHYLTTVLRLGKKKASVPYVRLFDDHGHEWLAKIMMMASGRPKKTEPLMAECIQQLRQMQAPNAGTSGCWLVLAPAKKKDRIRWTVEKCTELGAAGFVLLDTEYSESSALSLLKLQAYVIEAAEQCERLSVPHFLILSKDAHNNSNGGGDGLTTLDDFLASWHQDEFDNKTNLAVCRERSDQAVPLFEYLSSFSSLSNNGCVAFVVGPEGGWSPSEMARLDDFTATTRDNPQTVQSVSLGSSILRSETACMLAVGTFGLWADKEK